MRVFVVSILTGMVVGSMTRNSIGPLSTVDSSEKPIHTKNTRHLGFSKRTKTWHTYAYIIAYIRVLLITSCSGQDYQLSVTGVPQALSGRTELASRC